jgi:hypothetical protein
MPLGTVAARFGQLQAQVHTRTAAALPFQPSKNMKPGIGAADLCTFSELLAENR